MTSTLTNTPCARLKAHLASAPEAADALAQVSRSLAEHAQTCPDCQAEVTRARTLVSDLEGLHATFTPAPDLAARALAQAARPVPARAPAPARKLPWGFIGGGLVGAAAAAAIAVGVSSSPSTPSDDHAQVEPPAPKSTPVEKVNTQVATSDEGLGVRACLDSSAEVSCDVGRTLTTEIGESRAFRLTDGTLLHLDQDTVAVLSDDARAISVSRGEAFLDVAHREDLDKLKVTLPTGEVEVIGTALEVRAGQALSVVDVVRGVVAVESGGSEKRVRAGQAAYMAATKTPVVRASSGTAGPEAWSAKSNDSAPGYANVGFGSIRARRPGAAADTEAPLRLIDHVVTTRIQGMMAKTTVEESFRSDDDRETEGTYRFTLPAGAQVAELALLVDGEWEEGAFVARDRAEKIWAGVIRNATPVIKRREIIEYIWVPGPWRDPALLSWKQGNTFELRIFPIPSRGERRVRIAYTERLPLVTGGRRYTLPLPADKNAVRAERFSLDVQVGGDVDVRDLRVRNYDLTKETVANGIRLAGERKSFRPKGDLVVEVPDTQSIAELTGTGYTASNDDAYVSFALRPDFAEGNGISTEPTPIHVALIVDASYGTQKLRLERAAELAKEVAKGLGVTDRIDVIACATHCATIVKGEAPSAELADRIGTKIAKLEPMGTSRLAYAFDEANKLIQGESGGRIVYLGDGITSTGELDAHRLASAIRSRIGDVRVTTVTLGGETDALFMAGITKDHAGSFLDVAAIGSVPATARKLLARQHGEPLRDAELKLPEGVTMAAPTDLGDLWPGEERIVTGRVNRGTTGEVLVGEVELSGTMSGEPVDRKWTMSVPLAGRDGNAFVPRLWAEARIADLSKKDDTETIDEIVKLSQDHHVLSRHTSLLVLESPAMAKAFGVETSKPVSEWTGEEELQAQAASVTGGTLASGELGTKGTTAGVGDAPAEEVAAQVGHGAGGMGAGKMRGYKNDNADFDGTSNEPDTATSVPMEPAKPADPWGDDGGRDKEAKKAEAKAPDVARWDDFEQRGRRGNGEWVAMKKVWYKEASIRDHGNGTSWETQQLEAREAKWDEEPNSRERTLALVRWHVRMGQLDEAERMTQRWLERDRMDPDALVTLADIAARNGDMQRAEGWLASAVDADHRSSALQLRLADLYDATGDKSLACEHRLARALVARNDMTAQVDAVRCGVARERILDGLDDTMRTRVERALERDGGAAKVTGPFKVSATWGAEENVNADLDIVVVSPAGRVVSRLGGAVASGTVTSSVEDATSDDHEELAFKGNENGRWQVFVVRRAHDGVADAPERVEGTLRITAHGTTRRLSFVLGSDEVAAAVADIDVQAKFRMERVE